MTRETRAVSLVLQRTDSHRASRVTWVSSNCLLVRGMRSATYALLVTWDLQELIAVALPTVHALRGEYQR